MRIIIGPQIRAARNSSRISQQELASRAGISLATLQNIEAGRGNPSLDTLTQVLGTLGLELRIVSTGISWARLIALGLPLIAGKPSQTDTVVHAPSADVLRNELREVAGKRTQIMAGSRDEEALVGFLIALRDHYPTVWNHLSKDWEFWLHERPPSPRIVKLRRLALSRLGRYL